MNEVKTMVQIPLDLLESLIENSQSLASGNDWMQIMTA